MRRKHLHSSGPAQTGEGSAMLCPACQNVCRKFGYNRNGSQRHRCDECQKTYTDMATRPTDRRCLDPEKRALCMRMLLEGNSLRSTARLTGVCRKKILAAMVEAGQRCAHF